MLRTLLLTPKLDNRLPNSLSPQRAPSSRLGPDSLYVSLTGSLNSAPQAMSVPNSQGRQQPQEPVDSTFASKDQQVVQQVAGGAEDEQDVIADPNIYVSSNDEVEVVREHRSPSVRSRSRHSSLPSPLRIPAPPLVPTAGDNPSVSVTMRQDERPLPNPEDIRQLLREELRAMLRTEFLSQGQQPPFQEPPTDEAQVVFS